MRSLRIILGTLVLTAVACSGGSERGIADKRSDFTKFLPMTGNATKYGLRVVRPYFRRANRNEILHAIEAACVGGKQGSSVYNPETKAGYYVNCNPRNRQILNGYIPANPAVEPHSHP